MDLGHWLALIVIVLLAAGWYRTWRRSAAPGAKQGGPTDSGAGETAAPPSTPQGWAEAFTAELQASAHPRDVENSEALLNGARLLEDPAYPLDTVVDYIVGPSGQLSCMAAVALARRADAAAAIPRLVSSVGVLSTWALYFVLPIVARHAAGPVIWPVLLRAADWWSDNPLLPGFIDTFVAARLAGGEQPDLPGAIAAIQAPDFEELLAVLERLSGPAGDELRAQYHLWQRTRLDLDYLKTVGRMLTDDATLVEHESIREALDAAVAAVTGSPPVSFLALGDAGVGKTAFVRLLARRLGAQGWSVFEASAADLQAGQSFLGELEKRMRLLFAALAPERRVLWYVPRVHELHQAGTHRHSAVGILDLLLPELEAGRVCVIGESTLNAMERLLVQRPRLRALLKYAVIEPLQPHATLDLAKAVVSGSPGPFVADPVVSEALDLSRHFLRHQALPGSLLDLLRRARTRATAAGKATADRQDLVGALVETSGLPADVIDDSTALDVAALRERFESRVLGQPAAVGCLLDRVAMLKAGLTDPHRPVGVFLFAGPTGTGKTEVAKVLAEFLFGAENRMIRLDMSELQEASGLERILGSGDPEGHESDALAQRIRKQPFSLVLLDEFEKAHPRVWDLFLQVFDDGRLTDARGNMADFRHAIIILTSNLGAVAHAGTSLGFASGAGAFTEAQVMRAIAATFRPEFINRIDRVVVFQPLSRAVMRDILRKELRRVLERRGFRNRDWAVEWEESAIEFLLDRGFTPDMGARPLRRAIEQFVLGPIAQTIVEHRFPEGDQFLFVRSDGRGVQVEFVDPDAPPAVDADAYAPVDDHDASAPGFARSADLPALAATLAAMEDRVAAGAWQTAKEALLAAMSAPDYWSDAGRFAQLDRTERMDRIDAAIRAARSLYRRVEPRADRRAGAPASLVQRLAEHLFVLGHALDDLGADRASEVYLSVEAVADDASSRRTGEWLQSIVQMYERWAAARHMRARWISERFAARPVLSFAGLGVHGILDRESGLHVFETPDASGGFERATVRVRVAGVPVTPRLATQTALEHATELLGGEQLVSATVIRRYRAAPSPLVRDVRGWRTGRLDQVLAGGFDRFGSA
jgi:ATP-dependent Clp protease ATP-binding subunit ClpC